MPSNPEALSRADKFLLLALALAVNLLMVSLQPVPGYMDSAYYYATGIQLASGNGFTEPFVWNYLDAAQTIPHPSHAYWYPLASLVAALGMVVMGNTGFLSARIFFLLAATIAPLAVALLAHQVSGRRWLALTSGFLAIFSGYYLPFIVTTDNYGLYILIGAVYFLLLGRISLRNAFLLGLLAGFLNLARSDGLIWLPYTVLVVAMLHIHESKQEGAKARLVRAARASSLVLGGWLLVMGPWMVRNLSLFGTITPPGAVHVLWMTGYNQLFSFNPGQYTFASWLEAGWRLNLCARLDALVQNLATAVLAQGLIFLSPLILVAAWKYREKTFVRFAFALWAGLLLVESILFPYASVRGGFFHAGAVFQPVFFVLASLGAEVVQQKLSRTVDQHHLRLPLLPLLVVVAVAMSILLVKIRVIDSGWNEGEYRYLEVEQVLAAENIPPESVVITVNPPAYNAMTGRQAIVLPAGDIQDLYSAAVRFGAEVLVLERDRLLDPYVSLFDHPENFPAFTIIGGFDDVRILLIDLSP